MPNKTDTLSEFWLAVAKSWFPSPLKSPTTTEVGLIPTWNPVATLKPPAPSPNKTDTLDALLETARSWFPSPLKSPTATEKGKVPTAKLVAALKPPAPLPNNTDTVSVP